MVNIKIFFNISTRPIFSKVDRYYIVNQFPNVVDLRLFSIVGQDCYSIEPGIENISRVLHGHADIWLHLNYISMNIIMIVLLP